MSEDFDEVGNVGQYEENTYRLAEWLEELQGLINTAPNYELLCRPLKKAHLHGLNELAHRVRAQGRARRKDER